MLIKGPEPAGECLGREAETAFKCPNPTVSEQLTPVAVFPSASGVQEVSMPYSSVICARVNSALKCWGSDNGYGLIGNGKITRGSFSAVGFEL